LFDVCPQAAPMPNAKLTQMHSDYENVWLPNRTVLIWNDPVRLECYILETPECWKGPADAVH
jgi:hypothetical protein